MPRPSLLLLAGLAAGCGGAGMRTAPTSPAERAACLIGVEAAGGEQPVVAAAAGADTALLSDARSRTPLALDCEGAVRPRLASAWSHDSSRTAWTLTVKDAAALAQAWRARGEAAAALRHAGVASVLPLDQRRLVVTFGIPQDTVPGVFADPALASAVAQEPELRLARPGGDLRDALDGGADLVISADPTVLEYAAGRAGWTRYELPWNRTYVLLAPAGAAPMLDIAAGDSAAFRDALARDAVRVEARGARPPYWWEEAAACSRREPAPVPRTPRDTVLYLDGDPVARALAERIVALARSPTLVARGLTAAALESALARGAGPALVVAVPKLALVPCRETAHWPQGAATMPLVETRAAALVRDGVGPLAVDYDGGIVPERSR